jgi:hypothetical protein
MLRSTWLVPHAQNRQQNGGWQMLNEIIATVLLIVLAWFAAGSVELAEERTQRRRVQKQIREKYGRTY